MASIFVSEIAKDNYFKNLNGVGLLKWTTIKHPAPLKLAHSYKLIIEDSFVLFLCFRVVIVKIPRTKPAH